MHRRIVFLLIPAIACLFQAQAQVVGHLPEYLPRYKLVQKFSAGVQDQNSETILLQSYGGTIEQFDLASKTLSLLGTNNYGSPARLIPKGFLLHSTNGLLQIEGTNEINLGPASIFLGEHGSRVLEGRFGILQTTEGQVLRDFVARTNLLLSAHIGFVDVSANGSVVFTEFANDTNIAIRWFHDGQFETLALLPSFPHPYVATDGTNVLWSEPNFPFGSVFLHTPNAGRIELSTNTALAVTGWPPIASHKTSVAMKNGWTIFPRWATNNPVSAHNLWRRSPTGEITQLTTAPGYVYAMAEDGGAIIEGGDGRIEAGLYYFPPSGDPKPVSGGAPLARYFASGNKFYAYSPLQSGGTGLFEIELEDDPFVLIFPAYNSVTGKFSVEILPSMPGTFLIERTQDFTAWSPIHTVTLPGVWAFPVEITTEPGIFRLRKQ